jgi:hypothetical protein
VTGDPTGEPTGEFTDASHSQPGDLWRYRLTGLYARPGHPDRKEKAMFPHPHITSQLGREHQRQMLAAASQRQLRRQHRRQVSKAADVAAAVIRRLVTVIAEPSL